MDGTHENGHQQNGNKKSKRNGHYGSISADDEEFDWSLPNEHQAKVTDKLITDKELDEKSLKRRVWMNVGLMNVGSFLMVMAMAPIFLIQSSLNSEDGLGVTSMAVQFGCVIISSFFAPSIIGKLGCKLTLVIGILLEVTYIPANFYPSWFTLIPFAMLAGLGLTMYGVATKVYMARLAHLYSELTAMETDRINSRLFVLMVCTMQVSGALGSFVSSLILDVGADNGVSYNDSSADSRLSVCGIDYCNEDLFSVLDAVNKSSTDIELEEKAASRLYWMIGLCTLLGVLATVSMTFLSPLAKFGISSKSHQKHSSPLSTFKDFLRAMKDPRYILFIPMTIALNGGDSFYGADFTKGFISCSMGLEFLGVVVVWDSLSGTLSSLLFGWFNSRKIRSLPVLCATIFQIVALIGLFYWKPSSNSLSKNYWILSIFGIIFFFGSGIRRFISPVLVSVIFKNNLETAFSVYNFWTNAATTLFYAWSNFLCIRFKVYFLLVTIALSFIGYVGMEILIMRSTTHKQLNYKPLNGKDSS